jgi:hypothetical protein
LERLPISCLPLCQLGGEGAAEVLIDSGCVEALAQALSAAALPVLDGSDQDGLEAGALLASLHALSNHVGAQGALQPLVGAELLGALVHLTDCDAPQVCTITRTSTSFLWG